MTLLPDDLQRIADDLDGNLRRAEAVAGELDDRRINWQPSPTSWSIAQCLDHLNVANRIYLGLMRQAVEEARRKGRSRRGPFRQGFVERWFTESLEPPPRRRFPAPRQIVPASRRGKEEVLAEFRRLHADAASLLREATGLDLGVRFPNPFLPLVGVTVGSGFLVIATHERRHLWQAERVRQSRNFRGTAKLRVSFRCKACRADSGRAVPGCRTGARRSSSAVPPDGRPVPKDERSVQWDERSVPRDERAVPSDDRPVHWDGRPVPKDERSVPWDDWSVPWDERAVPSDDRAVHWDERPVPKDERSVPWDGRFVGRDGRPVPRDGRSARWDLRPAFGDEHPVAEDGRSVARDVS